MALDGITVANLVFELNSALADGHISKIGQPENDEILLTVKTKGGLKRVLMSASASLPMLCLTEENRPGPMTAPNFCMLLRKYIGSSRIVSVRQPSLERIVRFEIEHYDELGDLRTKYLIIELMGKYSNIIFCDDQDTVIDSIKHIGATTSSVREVLPGRKYFIPDTQHKSDPLNTSEDEFRSLVFSKPAALSKALYTSYTGLSPVIAEELCHRASFESDMSAKEVPEHAQLHLYRIFTELMEDVKAGRFEPNIIYRSLADSVFSQPVEFAAVHLSMYDDLPSRRFGTISEVLSSYYSEKSAASRMRQKSADLRHVVATLLEREAKKLDLQRRQMKDTEKKDRYRLFGELLQAYGYSIEPGAASAPVQNYYDENREITIPLDPQKTAAQNAQHYFDRYNKMKRTQDALTQQIAQTEAEVAQLEAVRTFLDQAQTEDDLAQIRDELTLSGYLHGKISDAGYRAISSFGYAAASKDGAGGAVLPAADRRGYVSTAAKKAAAEANRKAGKFISGKGGKKGTARTPKSRPYHYRTEDGYDIYIGKNNIQNDELTFHFAGNSDWWFHSKKIPGSHVIVKSHGQEELPDHIFEIAADAAAYYSQGRTADKVEIDYVKKKEVKKPNGSKPGFVVYYTNYSMVARPEIGRLTLLSE